MAKNLRCGQINVGYILKKKESTGELNNIKRSSVKHGGGSFMAWAYMAANGTGSLVFIDDVTGDRSSRMNSEVFKAMLTFSQILQNR